MKLFTQAVLSLAGLVVFGMVGLGIPSFIVTHYILSSVLVLGGYVAHQSLKGKYEGIAVRAIQNYQDRA